MSKSDDLKNRLDELFSKQTAEPLQPQAEPAAPAAASGAPGTPGASGIPEAPAVVDTPGGLSAAQPLDDFSSPQAVHPPNQEMLESAFEYLAIGMAIANLEGRFTQVNSAFAQILGYARADLVGKGFQDLTHPHDQKIGVDALDAMRNGETHAVRIEKRYLHRDGHPVWVELNITLIRDRDGQMLHFLTVVQDVSHQHRTALLLEKRVRELNCLNDIGHKIDEKPPLEDFLPWVTERIPAAFQYPDVCIAALEYGEKIYGDRRAREQASKVVAGLRLGMELVGWLHVAYTETRDFVDAESALLGSLVSRISGYIETNHLLAQAENTLDNARESQHMLSSAINNIPNPIFFIDTDGLYTVCNQAFLDYLGRPLDEVVGKSVYDMHTDRALADRYFEMDQELFRNPGVQTYESEARYADGTLHNMIYNKATFNNQDGCVAGLVGTMVDITERKQAELRLREEERQLEDALRLGKMAYWEFDVASQTFLFNPQWFDLYRATPEQEGDYHMHAAYFAQHFVHPESAATVGQNIMQAIQTDDPDYYHEEESRVVFGDGAQGYVLLRFRIQKDEQGRTVKLYGTNQDITDRKQAEIRLLEEEHQLEDALRLGKMAYWEFDVASQTFTFNPQWYNLFRTQPEQEGDYHMHAGYFAQHFVHPESAATVGQNIMQAIQTDDPDYYHEEESRVIFGDGVEGYVLLRIRVQKDEQGRTVKLYGTNQDITDRKQAALLLERRAAELATVAELSATITTQLDPIRLLQMVVDLTKERFGLYHAHIYQLNEAGNALELSAGAGAVGRQMTAEGWRIALDSAHSLVAQAARSRAGMTVNDVRQEKDFLPNPLLPDTRAELAVPLIVGEQVLGVLDVQSDQVGRFGEDDVQIHSTLAAQVAVALQNARQYASVRSSEELVRLIINATPDWVFVKDLNHRMVLANASMVSAMGTTMEDLIGKDDLELGFPPEYVLGDPKTGSPGYWADEDQVLRHGQTQTIHAEQNILNGTLHYFDVFKTPMRSAQGQITGLLGYVRDVTEREQLLLEAERQAQVMATLNEMGRVLSTSLDQERVLETIFTYTNQLMDAQNLFVALYDAQAGLVSFPLAYSDAQRVEIPPRPPRRSMTDHILQTAAPLLFSDHVVEGMQSIGLEVVTYGDDEMAKSWLGVPLTYGDRVLGVVAVQSTKVAGMYTERHKELLLAVAAQAANSFILTEQYQQTQRVLAETQENVRYLGALNELAAAINTALIEEEMYHLVGRFLSRVSSVDLASVSLVDPTGEYMDLYNLNDRTGRVMPVGVQVPIPVSASGQAVLQRRLLSWPEEGALETFVDGAALKEQGMQANMCAPLMSGGKLVGTLNVASAHLEHFADRDRSLLLQVAALVSAAVENRRLLDQVQGRARQEQALREISTRVRSSMDADTILRTAVRELGDVLGRKTFIQMGSETEIKPLLQE